MNFKLLTLYVTVALSAGCGKDKWGGMGEQGKDGSSCETIQTPTGATINCGNSTSDILNGERGPTGADGTTITIVQLCPGHTTYPSTFLEVAMCINNKLYGVYSANGGFMTELPPGNYSSNAIGSACNLTVLANCMVVSH
jgi:hypothetical protein